jgi:hypothetical protein
MIPDKDVVQVIIDEVPELKPIVFSSIGTVSIYQNVRLLADLTVKLIEERDLRLVRKCFVVAEKLLKEGSQTTKNAIENVFVYSVTTRTEKQDYSRNEVLPLLPAALKAEYQRQTHTACI